MRLPEPVRVLTRMRTGLRERLVITFILVAVAASALVAGIGYQLVKSSLIARTERAAVSDVTRTLEQISLPIGVLWPGELPPSSDEIAELRNSLGGYGREVIIEYEGAVYTEGDRRLTDLPSELRGRAIRRTVTQRLVLDDQMWLVIGAQVHRKARNGQIQPTGLTVYVFVSMADEERLLADLRRSLAQAGLITLLLAFTVALFSARRVLLPVRRLGAAARALGQGRLDVRLPVNGQDELAQLTATFNEMAAELEKSVSELRALEAMSRRFVADVSHELRSPLTALRTQLEVALVHPEDEDWPAVARAALDDADRLQKVVADVLTIAKLEAGICAEREPVDLGALARAEATDRPRRVPVHVQVRDVARPLIINGSRTQLVRVLTNLLDNAERHAESEIRLNVYRDGDEAVLEVADDGEGIPPEDRERVFQRFQRLPEGRRRDTQGSGLGLAISRDIAVAHGGSLVADESEQGGALLILRLPLRDPAPSTPEPSRR